jgi:putative inorganic carbon (HCO3(-)) transporter
MFLYYWLVGILPLMQHPLWGLKIGPLTVFEYVGVACFIYSGSHIAARGVVPPFLSTWETRLVLLLYLIALLSALTEGRGIGLANGPLIIYTSSFLLIFISVSVVDTVSRLRWTVLALIGSYGFASLYVIREWQQGRSIYSNFRPGWIVGDSNYFATTAIFGIVLAFYFMQGKRPTWEKIYSGVCLVLTIVASTFCASRGGFFGLAVASLFLVWHTKRRARNLMIMSALVLPLSVALPVSPLHRFLNPSSAETGSTQAHLEAWKAGFNMIKAHPIAGIGLGNFKPLMPAYMSLPPGTSPDVDSLAHNMFIEVAAELGLPALLIFLAIFWFTYRTLGKVRRSPSSHSLIRETASALQAGLVGFAVAGSFVSAEYQKTSWMGFALMFCLMPLARSMKHARRVPVPASLARLEEAALQS